MKLSSKKVCRKGKIMALRTDYKDDVLDTSVNTNRTFNMLDSNGQVLQQNISLVETTVFLQEGDSHTASITNAQNEAINEQGDTIEELQNSFSQALTSLKATAIAQAVGAVGNTFASVIATLATIVNRGAVSKTLGLGESYTIPQGYHNGQGEVSVSITSQEKTITASRSKQIVTPDSGKVLSKVTVNKYPDASGTYNATSRGSALDMGAGNNLRYVNTNGVPNTNSGTYSVTSNGTKDMGATNTNRYVSVNVPASEASWSLSNYDSQSRSRTLSVTNGGVYLLSFAAVGNASETTGSVSLEGGDILAQLNPFITGDTYGNRATGSAFIFRATSSTVTISSSNIPRDDLYGYSVAKIS